MRTLIVVRTQFSAIHAWKDCPIEEVSFLRNPHRHMFFVELKCQVTHANRQLEFFVVKKKLERCVDSYRDQDIGSRSCEMLAVNIAAAMENELNPKKDNGRTVIFCSVFEDNENGAEWHYA